MVADEIIQEVCEGLGLASDESKSRVARRLNARYRRATSSIGLDTTRRVVVSKAASVGVSTITFTGVEKLLTVYTVNGTVNTILDQITPEDMLNETAVSDNTPTKYAINRIYPTSIDVLINSVPSGAGFTLYAQGETSLTTLSGSAQPQFPESFHDLLVFGVMADEYRKMEKTQLAQAAEADYERRLSDLRMWIAKTSWMDVYQGKNQSTKWWQQDSFN